MINNKSVLAIIPARGASKGIKRKNVRSLAGKPLIAWTIEEGKKSKYIDKLIVSSEDEEILGVARQFGAEVPFVRPEELAQDETLGIDPVIHALRELPGYDYIVLLQPTSPLRSVQDIDECIEQMIETEAPACVSVTEPEKSPYWMYTLQEDNRMRPLIPQGEVTVRRQDLPPVFSLNGAVYVACVKWLLEIKSFLAEETIAYVMPKNRSYDIDMEEDFLLCEWMMKRRNTV